MTREELKEIVAIEDYQTIMKAIDLYTSEIQKDNEILVNTILTEKDKRIEELRADNESISDGRTAYAKTCSVLSEENFNLQKRIEELEKELKEERYPQMDRADKDGFQQTI